MMVSEKESQTIRKFVCRQLRNEPDLSTLTIGILKRQYLKYVGHESLSSEVKHFMKRVVEEELVKMQDNDCNESTPETKVPQNKRKREEESDGESEDESRAKKPHSMSSSSSESEDEKESKTATDTSEDEEQVKPGSRGAKKKRDKADKQQISSGDSSDEETKEAQTDDEGQNEKGGSPKEPRRKKENTVMNGKSKSSKISENESDSDSKSEKSAKRDSNESSDDDDDDDDNNEKGHVTVEKRDEDSDSSSLPSIQDDEEADKSKKKVKKKTKEVTKREKPKSESDGAKTVARLKHYITLCGVRRNYKKLFQNCHSIRSQVAVLKKELEDLGVKGQPSIQKCKKIKMRRESAEEIASLDVNNIICSQGRSKRGTFLNERRKSPSSTYQRTLSSGSDSDRENKTQRRTTDWKNLQGIISDDADSD